MNTLLWNVFLATVWAFAIGEFSLFNLGTGFALAYAIMWLGREVLDSESYCRRLPKLIELLGFLLWKLLQANFRVALDVVTPQHRMRAGIIAVPLDADTDREITLLASMISLTPGTMSLGVSPDHGVLYVHVLYISDVEQEKREIKEGFERRLLEVLR